MKMIRFFILALVLGVAQSNSAQAQLPASDTFDVLPNGGTGWAADWSEQGPTLTPTLSSASELVAGSGSYLTLAIESNSAYTRDYSPTTPTDEHTISFLFRVDAYDDDATGDPSRAFKSYGGASVNGLSGGSTWAVYLQNDTFHYFDGDGNGDFAGAQVDSGVAFNGTGTTSATSNDIGDVFEVTIVNRIGAGSLTLGQYDLTVDNLTDGTNVLALTDLNFRRNAEPVGTFLNVGGRGTGHSISIDDVSVTTAEVPFVLCDVDMNGTVDFRDITPFIAVLSGSAFQAEADCNEDGEVNFLDILPFIAMLSGS